MNVCKELDLPLCTRTIGVYWPDCGIAGAAHGALQELGIVNQGQFLLKWGLLWTDLDAGVPIFRGSLLVFL
jgi:hypothetical protein